MDWPIPAVLLFTLPSSLVLLPQKLPCQELPNLFGPVHPFQEDHRDFHFFQMLFFQPYVEETFGEEAVDPGFVGAVAADVDAAFQGEENVEEPAAVLVEQGLFHGEHVQDMEFPPVHDGGKGLAVVGVFFGDDFFHFVQVFFVMGVLVLAADGFDVVVPLHRQDHVVLAQELFVVGLGEDGILFVFQVIGPDTVAKIPTVMAQADIVAFQVFPGPVQPGKFAVIGVLGGNIFPRIVPRKPQRSLPLRPNLERKVNRVRRNPVRFVDGDEDFCLHDGYGPFLSTVTSH